MNSLLRSVNYTANKRNMLVRESLQQQLTVTCMEMQSAPGALEGSPVEICDEALALCSSLEAIFLHGLKDSLLNRVTEALSGPDYDAMPQPSFWGPLLVVSHRQIIDQIQSLSQLTTEVGYCRAWIRLALNEGLLSSYLSAIRRDNSALKPYYNRAAFMRDADLVEVAQRLVESIDYIRFDLACNSSLLNFWSSTPLLMAAIWSPPMKSCPVFSAVDIAKTISCERPTSASDPDNLDDIETASSIGSLSSFNSSSQINFGGLSEDEALRVILAKKSAAANASAGAATNAAGPQTERPLLTRASLKPLPIADIATPCTPEENGKFVLEEDDVRQALEDSPKLEVPGSSEVLEQLDAKREETEGTTETAAIATTSVGNSLLGKLGWSGTAYEEGEQQQQPASMTSSVLSRPGDGAQSPAEGPTYDALLRSYHTGNYRSPRLEELLEKYPSVATATYEPTLGEPRERQSYDEQLGRLAREKGLDLQNYNCLECGQMIGLNFAKANVCHFTGHYFCCNCMASEEHLVPARVVHNWDLKRYPVCLKAAKYLTECTTLLDLKLLNPRIYSAVGAMAQLQTLRVQLNLLRAYLFTCREPIIESLQNKVAPRDYLYEHVHQYSVADLADIPNGTLAQQLQKVVEFARSHVVACWLCSQKGFICEVCNNPKVIYPFDVQSTYRCGACNAVFHIDCLNSSKPCPKCERKKKRIDLPLLDMENSDILNETTTISPPIATT